MLPLLSCSGSYERNAVDRVGMLLNDRSAGGKMSNGKDGWKCFDQGLKYDSRAEGEDNVNSGFNHNQMLSSNYPMTFSWLVLNKKTNGATTHACWLPNKKSKEKNNNLSTHYNYLS